MTSNYKYPLLKKILEVYDFKKESLDGIYILACQHILEPQAKMLEILNEYGIPKENMIIFGKIYSTSNEVLNEMSLKDFNVSQAGFNPNISFDTQHLENCEREFNNFVKQKVKLSYLKTVKIEIFIELLKNIYFFSYLLYFI